jgi:heme/copper-type cytochrome/quinol oxidase subunit 1
VSSIGSLISVISVLLFFIILWEAFAREHQVIEISRERSSLEWLHPYPPAEHSYDELPIGTI